MPTLTDRQETALHEAAHAVVAWRYGIEWQRVSIVADLDRRSAGHCAGGVWRETGAPVQPLETSLDVLVTIAVAGGVLGSMITGAVNVGSCLSDLEKSHGLAELIRELGEENWEQLIARCSSQAARILIEQQPALRTLAGALMQRREMTSEEVRELVQPVWVGPISPDWRFITAAGKDAG